MNQIQTLAKQFTLNIQEDLEKSEWLKVIKTNLITADDTCATGDHIDSNMTMDRAFTSVMGHEMNGDSDEDVSAWNRSWTLAKKAHFGASVAELMEAFGFEEWQTGGGCTCYGQKYGNAGNEILITEEDGPEKPATMETLCLANYYWREGQEWTEVYNGITVPQILMEIYEFTAPMYLS